MPAVDRTDLVIAGGGPAGLATAIRARLEGLEATVLETGSPPIDKACGEGLMPDGVARLEALGIDVTSLPKKPFHGIRYLDGNTIAEGRFPDLPGVGIRRIALHDALQKRAREVGVDLRWGIRVHQLLPGGFDTSAGQFHGRWLVGADGRTSRIRRLAGLDGRPAARKRFGVRRHYKLAPWTDLVEVYWTDSCEAYVTPIADDQVGVALLWEGKAAGFDALLARVPELQDRLEGAPATSSDRGAGPLEQRSRRVAHGNLALVGDASGSIDAISGEGLALALHESSCLIEAILANDFRQYVRAHRGIVRFPRAMTRLLLLVERHPRLRRKVMRSLSSDPTLMSRFLALKLNTDGPRMLGSGGLVDLALAAVRGGS